MSLFDDIAIIAEDTAKSVERKASQIVDYSKRTVEISVLREKLSREYEKLGMIVAFDKNIYYDASDSSVDIASSVNRINYFLMKLEEKGAAVKCKCGAIIEKNSNYCSRCGEKIYK